MAEASGGGGGMMNDLFLFVGIVMLVFVVWASTGGPTRPISFQGPYLNPITEPGTNAEAYGERGGFGGATSGISIGGYGVNVSLGEGTAGPSSSSGNVQFLRDTSGAKETDVDEEYVTIFVSPSAGGAISTAGWKLVRKETGQGAAFPQGAEVPQSGRVNVLSPTELLPGDTAIIVSGRSPVGVSFRENKCTGYFEERQNFRPPLSLSCPTPYQEYALHTDGDEGVCATFIRSIPYCETGSDTRGNPGGFCEEFVEEYLHYSGCVDAHEEDSSFKSSTWRIFLGKSDELWKSKNETILLLDKDGAVIDSLSY